MCMQKIIIIVTIFSFLEILGKEFDKYDFLTTVTKSKYQLDRVSSGCTI